jgi:hypothetical protein
MYSQMTNVVFRTDKQQWKDASLAKKELAFFRGRNVNGRFDDAIKQEEDIIRSFTRAA